MSIYSPLSTNSLLSLQGPPRSSARAPPVYSGHRQGFGTPPVSGEHMQSRALCAPAAVVAGTLALVLSGSAAAQSRQSTPIPPLPQVYETDVLTIRVVEVAGGFANPWSMAWLPNGDLLVTERAGRLRILRGGRLDPTPIPGVPQVRTTVLGGLLEVLLHPDFASNRYVYLSYSKGGENNLSTTAI